MKLADAYNFYEFYWFKSKYGEKYKIYINLKTHYANCYFFIFMKQIFMIQS